MGGRRQVPQAPARRLHGTRHRNPEPTGWWWLSPTAKRDATSSRPTRTTSPRGRSSWTALPRAPVRRPLSGTMSTGQPTSNTRAPVSVEPSRRRPRSRTSWPSRGRSRRTRRSPRRPTRRPSCTPRPRRDFEAFWAKPPASGSTGSKPFDEDPRVGPAVRQVVHRRRAERRLQLRRPARRARPRRQGRLPLDRRAGRHADAHLRATSSARSARPPTRSRSSASRPATGSRSTCR